MARVYKRTELQPAQTQLNIQPSLEQLLADTRYRLKARQQELELQPFWKNIEPVLAMLSSVTLSTLVFLGAILNANKLPPEIPFFYDASIGTWRSADISLLFIAPVVYLIVVIVLMRAVSLVFGFDRKLATLACGLVIFFNMATIIAVAQVASIFNIVS